MSEYYQMYYDFDTDSLKETEDLGVYRLKASDFTARTDCERTVLYQMKVAITGGLDSMRRKDAYNRICQLGGSPVDRVTGKTNILVIGNGVDHETIKIKKAKTKGTRVMMESDFCNIVNA